MRRPHFNPYLLLALTSLFWAGRHGDEGCSGGLCETGKRSYGLVAEYGGYDPEQDSPLFRKLSENFELCVTGLGFVRSDLDRMQDPACRRVKDLLLN